MSMKLSLFVLTVIQLMSSASAVTGRPKSMLKNQRSMSTGQFNQLMTSLFQLQEEVAAIKVAVTGKPMLKNQKGKSSKGATHLVSFAGYELI